MRCSAATIIHGPTHRPALHANGGQRCFALPDWELDAAPERGGWIALDSAGCIRRYDLQGNALA